VAVAEIDAIVLADDPLSREVIAGLSARERAVRVARRVGAARVFVIERDRSELATWRGERTGPLLVIRADQVVHPPLVEPLVSALPLPADGVAIAVGPDNAYAGAYIATGSAARHAVAAIAKGENNAAFAGAADAARIPHGEIARHAIATPTERKAAERLLLRILIKPQDNMITRYVYRPVSLPMTRVLVRTPVTPNQISIFIAVLVAIGCWMSARASFTWVIAGTALIQVSQYFDCCDGEIARLKLMSSRFGAWIDTIVDELSTIGYVAALGVHCHLHYGGPGLDLWLALAALGVFSISWSVYCIYYNIIVAVGSQNSQDYADKFEVVPGAAPNTVRLRPVAAKIFAPTKPLHPVLASLVAFAPNIVRRDFITWAALGLAVLHLTRVSLVLQVAGGLGAAFNVTIDHVRLRRLRRSIVASGQILEPALPSRPR